MKVKVIPNAGAFRIAPREGRIIVKVRSRAEDGRANAEVLKELGKITGRKVHLLKGSRSREKELAFEGLEDEEAGRILKDYAGVAEPGQKK